MLYVFHGTNIQVSRKKAISLVDSLRTKKPDASYVRVEAEQWSPQIIEEHLSGQGLFSNKYIIFLDQVTENSEAKEKLIDFIQQMKQSTNIFILLESRINAELKKSLEKFSEKIVENNVSENTFGSKKVEFNIFSLADAVGERNSLKSWTLYRQAIDSGIEPENIIGTLFWQVKSIILATKTKSATEAGLSPFVFSKAKKSAGNYSIEELNQFSTSLITIYHDAHRGMVNAEFAVEKLMLGLRKR